MKRSARSCLGFGATLLLLLMGARPARADGSYGIVDLGAGTPVRVNSAGQTLVARPDGTYAVVSADGASTYPVPTFPGGTY